MKTFRLFQEAGLQRSIQQAHHRNRPRLETINRISRGVRARATSQPSASYSSSTAFTAFTRLGLLFKQSGTPLVRRAFAFAKRPNSTKPNFNPTPNLGSPEPSLSLTQRLRKLSREYGWSALGVYLLLAAVDFPFCFLAVRWLGTDRIGHWEHMIVERFWKVVEMALPNIRGQARQAVDDVERVGEPVGRVFSQVDTQSNEVGVPVYDHGVKEAEQRNKAEASECCL